MDAKKKATGEVENLDRNRMENLGLVKAKKKVEN